jgi:hypothetical protein
MAKFRSGNSAGGMRDITAAKALQVNIADQFSALGFRLRYPATQ